MGQLSENIEALREAGWILCEIHPTSSLHYSCALMPGLLPMHSEEFECPHCNEKVVLKWSIEESGNIVRAAKSSDKYQGTYPCTCGAMITFYDGETMYCPPKSGG